MNFINRKHILFNIKIAVEIFSHLIPSISFRFFFEHLGFYPFGKQKLDNSQLFLITFNLSIRNIVAKCRNIEYSVFRVYRDTPPNFII